MEVNLSLDAIKHTRRFDGTLFQNWKHSMEIMFEFKDLKDIVEVRLNSYKKPLDLNLSLFFLFKGN